LDGHANRSCLKYLGPCRENDMEMFRLLRHTLHTPKPLNITVFKPIKRQQTLCINTPMIYSPNFILEKFSPELGTEKKQLTTLSKGMSAQTYFLMSSTVPDDKWLPSRYFHILSTDSLSPDTPVQTSFSSSENPTPIGSLLLQSPSNLPVPGLPVW